jgi:hypothetical protein
MAYLDYASELVGWVPKLPFPLAQKIINRAWHDICESRLWSFLISETVLTIPPLVGNGTASFTQFSNQVVGDATAAAVWNTLANPAITSRQIRLAQGPVYSIVAYDNATSTITLDRLYQESTNATANYLMYRCYYTVPTEDFLRWITVYDPLSGFWIKLNKMQAEINAMDPTRGSLGDAFWMAAYKTDPTTTNATYQWAMYEMWPHPTNPKGLLALYQRRGNPFVLATDSLPPQISEHSLIARARYWAYEWAEGNKGRIPELRGSDYRFLMGAANAEFKESMIEEARNDEEAFLQNLVVPTDRDCWLGPIDARWAQSHDAGWLG